MAYPLVLALDPLPSDVVTGIYTIKGRGPNRMPDRALFLHPEAAEEFLEISDTLIVSDIFRSPESSLAAVQSGRGALPPGRSAHNFGLAVDLDVRKSMARNKFKTKKELDEYMEAHGFYCHRRDHQITDLKGESHHFNFLGVGTVIGPRFTSTSGWIEARIQKEYGKFFTLTSAEIQKALTKLRLYSGAIDGQIGPLSKQAIRVFRRGWGLGDSDQLTADTMRTLAYVSCERSA